MLEDNYAGNAFAMGERLRQGLTTIHSMMPQVRWGSPCGSCWACLPTRYPRRTACCDVVLLLQITHVRGKGLLNAIVVDRSATCNAKKVCLDMATRGLLAKPTHDDIIRFAPPLMINAHQIDDCLEIIETAVRHVTKEGPHTTRRASTPIPSPPHQRAPAPPVLAPGPPSATL